eukprot:jgi/Hompol1/2617/HPOL_002979-RA
MDCDTDQDQFQGRYAATKRVKFLENDLVYGADNSLTWLCPTAPSPMMDVVEHVSLVQPSAVINIAPMDVDDLPPPLPAQDCYVTVDERGGEFENQTKSQPSSTKTV